MFRFGSVHRPVRAQSASLVHLENQCPLPVASLGCPARISKIEVVVSADMQLH
jgi:hypothetical protein